MLLHALLLTSVLAHGDTIRARLLARLGDDASTTGPGFGEVSGFAFDSAGRLYVSDFQDARIVVFGPDGRALGVIGRHGRGPGEFSAPTGPVTGPDGALYVRDLTALKRFTRDPRTGLAGRYDRDLPGPTFAPWRAKRPTYLDAAGRYYFPLEWGDAATGQPVRSFVRYDGAGTLVDTLPVPRYPGEPSLTASVQVTPQTGRMLPGLNAAPFEPRTVWTVTPRGTVISGDGGAPTLQETDAQGRRLRTLDIGGAGRRIPARERAESLAALRRRLDSLPGPLSAVRGMSPAVREQRLPDVYPSATGLVMVGEELWVRRWAEPGATRFDRFRLDGTSLGGVLLPVQCTGNPAPTVRAGRIACLVADAETGAETVALLMLPR
ncbi:MAG TPA: hypothetical protein VFS07_04295 [Gemmatimonadales bacterium]|nr:hypothetical protein [Gemmatimonadales bacterium]